MTPAALARTDQVGAYARDLLDAVVGGTPLGEGHRGAAVLLAEVRRGMCTAHGDELLAHVLGAAVDRLAKETTR